MKYIESSIVGAAILLMGCSTADNIEMGSIDGAKNSASAQLKNNVPVPGSARVAWDEFNHRGLMIWGCREIDTGKFVNRSMCASKPKEDTVWLDKLVPENYMGD